MVPGLGRRHGIQVRMTGSEAALKADDAVSFAGQLTCPPGRCRFVTDGHSSRSRGTEFRHANGRVSKVSRRGRCRA
jgi:hypothetical protein